MKRLISYIGIVVIVFGSLITFPAYLPWMVAIWIVVSLIAGIRQKPMWPWLLGCIAILIVKRPGFTTEFWFLLSALGIVALLDWRKNSKLSDAPNFRRCIIPFAVLALANFCYGHFRWQGGNTLSQKHADERPIACLGDSLTDFGYPQELEKLISIPVADFGVNGIETKQGIELIPDILKSNPQLVVIELGGHDYNKGKSRSETRVNLETLIRAFREQEIHVVLVEIPRGFVSDPFDGLERELAAKFDLQLIEDTAIRNLIYSSSIMPPGIWLPPNRRLSDDGLHPNELGNKYLARVVYEALHKVLGDRIKP